MPWDEMIILSDDIIANITPIGYCVKDAFETFVYTFLILLLKIYDYSSEQTWLIHDS